MNDYFGEEYKSKRTLRSKTKELHRQFHIAYNGKESDHKAGYEDTIFTYFVARLDEIEEKIDLLLKKKTKIKRKPSEWNIFIREQLRQDKTIKEAAILWKQKLNEVNNPHSSHE